MNILLTNDDGIHSHGLIAIYKKLSEIGNVTVVAPAVEQSATSSKVTIFDIIKLNEVGLYNGDLGYSLTGTPTDCVNIAINKILSDKPDLVVSGINLGANTADGVRYSGTVAAAMEGLSFGIPSMAVSHDISHEDMPTDINCDTFYTSASFAAKFVSSSIRDNALSGSTMLNSVININVPKLPQKDIKGVLITKQGTSKYSFGYQERLTPMRQKYFWLSDFNKMEGKNTNGPLMTDEQALMSGYISITPLKFDKTCYDSIESLNNLVF